MLIYADVRLLLTATHSECNSRYTVTQAIATSANKKHIHTSEESTQPWERMEPQSKHRQLSNETGKILISF